MKEIVLDTETTGISAKDGHRIVEIGCIELNDLIPTNNRFHCYLNPDRKVSEKALSIHGYTDEFLSDKKKFSAIVEEFLNFIDNIATITENVVYEGPQGVLITDNVVINLISKSVEIFMNSPKDKVEVITKE